MTDILRIIAFVLFLILLAMIADLYHIDLTERPP